MMRATRMIPPALTVLLAASTLAAAPRAEPPVLPPVSMALRIDAPAATALWKIVVTNTGEQMLRLAADGRLLRLELQPPPDATAPAKKSKTRKKNVSVECRAPAPLRPTSVDEDRAVLLPPGARYEEWIDPTLFCFGGRQKDALVPGTSVVAKLGFPPAPARRGRQPRQASPFVAEPTSATATVAPVKELVAPSFVLPETPEQPKAPAAPARPPADADPGAPRLAVSSPDRIDAASASSLAIVVTASNAGKRPLLANLRTENVSFDVNGPGGAVHCEPWGGERTLVNDFFRRMSPGSRQSLTILPAEICPEGSFARPGVYRVTPIITVSDESDQFPAGAWTGRAVAAQPTLVRIRSGSLPFYAQPPQVLVGPAARP
jgi:hypothetical protein